MNEAPEYQTPITCVAQDLGIDDLVKCLVEYPTCSFALSFGNGWFCEHPRRKDIAANTKKVRP